MNFDCLSKGFPGKKQFPALCLAASVSFLLVWIFMGDITGEKVGLISFGKLHWNRRDDGKEKALILLWSDNYSRKEDVGRKWESHCCESVEITEDRSQLEKATAIVIFNSEGSLNISDLPKMRWPDQLWVLFAKESPHYSHIVSNFNSLFNWTMLHRLDSEIWAPFGEYVPLERAVEEVKINGIPVDEWISNKTRLLAGVIDSNCETPSLRELAIKSLRENGSIPVHIYGVCGKRICNRKKKGGCNHTDFWTKLGSNYQFYLAAESSICVDSITEKFWRALQYGMIPVTYGGGNYEEIAPPGSFIDSRDFLNFKELAKYLKTLNKNPKLCQKYFEWRKKFDLRMGEVWQGWCSLCNAVVKYRKDLKEDSAALSMHFNTYDDLDLWWSHKSKNNKGSPCAPASLSPNISHFHINNSAKLGKLM